MTLNKRTQPILYFAGGTPTEEDSLESDFPYPGLIGKKGPYNTANDFTAADVTLLGNTPGDCEIQLVRVATDSPTIPVLGAVAWWKDEAAGIVTTLATQAGRVAGIFMAAMSAVADSRLTYIVKEGFFPVLFVAAPTVAPDALGKSVVPSATNAKADVVTVAAMTYQFARSAGVQVNSVGNRLDDTALASIKVVD